MFCLGTIGISISDYYKGVILLSKQILGSKFFQLIIRLLLTEIFSTLTSGF